MRAHILPAGDGGGACHLLILFSMSQGAGLYHLFTQVGDLLSSKAGSQDSCNPRITVLRRVRQENCYEFQVSQGYIVSLSQNKIFWHGGSGTAVIPASGDAEVIPGQLEIHGELRSETLSREEVNKQLSPTTNWVLCVWWYVSLIPTARRQRQANL